MNKHPFKSGTCLERLMKEYVEHRSLVIGFDFDNTIYDVHDNGGDYTEVIDLLKRCKALGFKLCLYTAELDEERLKWKIQYCKYKGIEPDYINESPLISGTKKPFFNILLDDRAGLEEAYKTLLTTVIYAETEPGRKRQQ